MDSRPRQVPAGLKVKDLCGIPWRVAFALQADGWWLRSDIIWSKPNPMPESVTDRPTKAHEYLFLLTKSARYYYDADAVREAHQAKSLQRYEYGLHTQRAEFGKQGKVYPGQKISNTVEDCDRMGDHINPSGRNRRTVWHIATAPYSGAHFATYPPALVEPCIKAGTSERGVCPECGAPWERVTESTGVSRERNIKIKTDKANAGINEVHSLNGKDYQHQRRATNRWRPTCECRGVYSHIDPGTGDHLGDEVYTHAPIPATVFDPFCGSGTTLQVARALGRSGVGLDLSLEYLHLARTRLSLDALDAWTSGGKKDGKGVTDLPMFKED